MRSLVLICPSACDNRYRSLCEESSNARVSLVGIEVEGEGGSISGTHKVSECCDVPLFPVCSDGLSVILNGEVKVSRSFSDVQQ